MSANIHGSCVALGRTGLAFGAPKDAGVLLLGDSGSGKSDLTLRLLEHGAMLVSDDRTELFLDDGELWASPPLSIAGLLEVRGVGILKLSHAARARVSIAVLLTGNAVPRLPEPEFYDPPGELACPLQARPRLFRLSAWEASAPAKVVAATAAQAQALFHHDRDPI
jgi:serine kinase of HPr protein (carbohydrate metabolism regulator)